MNFSAFRVMVLIGLLSSPILAQTSGPTYFYRSGDTVKTRADSLRLKVGNVYFWSTGKDIGTASVPVDSLFAEDGAFVTLSINGGSLSNVPLSIVGQNTKLSLIQAVNSSGNKTGFIVDSTGRFGFGSGVGATQFGIIQANNQRLYALDIKRSTGADIWYLDTTGITYNVGDFRFTATGKDIGTSGTRVDSLYVEDVNANTGAFSDSVSIGRRLRFGGYSIKTDTIPGSISWDSTQRAFGGWEYIVHRYFDMTHSVVTASVVDSNSSSETTLYSLLMGKNYPSVGKMVQTKLYGDYAVAGGGSKTITFRVKKGTTVLDSLVITTAAGGTTLRPWHIENVLTFRKIGASGSLEIFTEFNTESGDTDTYAQAVAIDTTTDNTLTFTVQISATGASYVRLHQGHTTTKQ